MEMYLVSLRWIWSHLGKEQRLVCGRAVTMNTVTSRGSGGMFTVS